ncbi:hypothetical protein GJAV_G00252620 [Gymnothorax javanicus]|nr:hypothetical protein GJAV_G00252620 [Gymnothorax javanicus]
MSDVIASCKDLDLDIPQSLQDLVPAAKKMALLFHMSYHSLAKFPDLVRIIGANAVEAQKAFDSSEALLWQCISTIDNMVTSLFPMLKAAVEEREAPLAVKYLGKARGWIEAIIGDTDQMVDQYGKLIQSVARATNTINTVKVQTDQKNKKLIEEQKALKDKVAGFQIQEKEKQSELAENENMREAACKDRQKVVDEIADRNRMFGVIAAMVPLIGFLIDATQRAINDSEDRDRLMMAQDKIKVLRDERANLSHELGTIQAELMHWQLKLSKSSIKLGAVPDPVHLTNVQQNLTRVKEILLQLKSFWKKTEVLIRYLEQKTFVGEEMIDFTEESKIELLQTIRFAREAWITFKKECKKSSLKYAVENKDAYKFLETDPSSLTDEEWKKQYKDLKTRLKNLNQTPTAPAVEGSPGQAGAE